MKNLKNHRIIMYKLDLIHQWDFILSNKKNLPSVKFMDKQTPLWHNYPIKECNYASDCSHKRLKEYNLNLKSLSWNSWADFYYKNGYGDMVIMSMETFEKSTFLNNLYDKLAIAEADLKASRVSDVDDAISDIRKKYGL